MTKLEIEAIQKLPDNYVLDGTCTCLFDELVIAMNPNLIALKYENGQWSELEIASPTLRAEKTFETMNDALCNRAVENPNP